MTYEYDAEKLRKMRKVNQKKIMEDWFRSLYEDPAENCPHDEGEYVYIYGGPYSAEEELSNEFAGIVKDDVIQELVDDLSSEGFEWSPIPTEDWYDIDYINGFTSDDPYSIFVNCINQLHTLLASKIPTELENIYYKMLYANSITSMETYLRDTFVSKLLKSQEHIKTFLKENKEFKDQKFTLGEVYEDEMFVLNKLKQYLAEILWHNIAKVAEFYKFTFKVQFPKCANIHKAVSRRHDIVHRNGKTIEGTEVLTEQTDVLSILEGVQDFITKIEEEVNPVFKTDIF